jgi:DNA-binding NtrC family response regulator
MKIIFGSTYSVGFATSANEAGHAMEIFEPGVVFFELRQADMGQLAQVVDALAKYCGDSALIVAASKNTRELEMFARSNNVFYYMLRPFNLKELWDAIECGFKSVEKKSQEQ